MWHVKMTSIFQDKNGDLQEILRNLQEKETWSLYSELICSPIYLVTFIRLYRTDTNPAVLLQNDSQGTRASRIPSAIN